MRNYNVKLFVGRRNSDGSFPISISFSGNGVEYLMMHKSDYVFKMFEPGITLSELERLYHVNRRDRRSNEIKNSLRHILFVARDYIKYEKKGGVQNDEPYITPCHPSFSIGP
ncbi:MAG: hypothetical protein IJK60_11150 [Clostridia bacterium]|nr:hypothetical protein [Clostridia bacterium]